MRRSLRDQGTQVISVGTIPEQMLFDVKWFVVEAGKPVRVMLTNADAMPHNLLIGQPGSVNTIGTIRINSATNGQIDASDFTLATGPAIVINGAETGQTTVLSVWDGEAPVVVRVAENPERLVRIVVAAGSRLPASWASTMFARLSKLATRARAGSWSPPGEPSAGPLRP